jgi:hypothetical protein
MGRTPEDRLKTPLPNKEQVEQLRARMKELGIESLTLEQPSVGILGVSTPKISYTVKESVDRISKVDPKNVQEVVASQVELLNNYYTVVLDQAKKSFRWALIAAGIGLAFFIAAVSFLLIANLEKIAVISIVSGALIEVISGINFFLYGRTAAQLSEFHFRLDTTQKFLLANSVCEGLDEEHKNAARTDLVNIIASGPHVTKVKENGELRTDKA